MNARKVAVLRGGPSDEYELSMQTGSTVLGVLAESGYDTEDIIISKSGEWLKNGIVKSPQDALAVTDGVFVALHGAYGEDGTVQRILDRLSVPYTGSGAFASALAMNKMVAKEHLAPLGIRMPKHMRVTYESLNVLPRIVSTIATLFGPSYVVKPIASGASVNMSYAHSAVELIDILEEVLEQSRDVLVEEFIEGRDATCGVLERFRNEQVYSMPTTEVAVLSEPREYATQLLSGNLEHESPGRFSRNEKSDLETLAAAVHKTLGLSQYSRSDFRVAKDGIYFLEVNTLPYLGSNSPFVSSLNSVGASERDLVTQLLATAPSKN